jgi:hypothetical protein
VCRVRQPGNVSRYLASDGLSMLNHTWTLKAWAHYGLYVVNDLLGSVAAKSNAGMQRVHGIKVFVGDDEQEILLRRFDESMRILQRYCPVAYRRIQQEIVGIVFGGLRPGEHSLPMLRSRLCRVDPHWYIWVNPASLAVTLAGYAAQMKLWRAAGAPRCQPKLLERVNKLSSRSTARCFAGLPLTIDGSPVKGKDVAERFSDAALKGILSRKPRDIG